MEKLLNKLKAAGVQVNGESAAITHLLEVDNFHQAFLGLVRQGRSIGVTFTSDPLRINGPAIVEALDQAGFDKGQISEIFANVPIQFAVQQ